ncbi:alginate O-acetyltransferase AlgX-related protein [Leifsonia sp. 2MCAF36]|uniref:alginate O-acetyltransferase AlgX-related protein n=1 Tax=Leifsonia sp. 2MCAF36 TaxID=3232988 RepID=UPI003F9E0D43
MSLRELPPDQQVRGGRRRWGRLYYVPLVVLFTLSAVAAGTGYAVKKHIETAPPALDKPAAVSGPAKTSTTALPEVCHPAVEKPKQQLWLTGKADQAEKVWDAHKGDLSKDYVTGKDGYVFWNDIQAMNFSQAVGRRALSVDEAADWHTYLASLRDELKAKGIPFYVVVTPAKWDVYPQELPDWAQSIRGSGPLDQLMHQYPDLPIIDLRAPLRDASKTTPTYSRVNSHWTDYGAYVGWKTVADCINTTDPTLGPLTVPASTGVTTTDENNEFAPYGISSPVPDWTTPTYDPQLKSVDLTKKDGTTTTVDGATATDLSLLPVSTKTTGAATSKSLLFLRDSMGNGLSVTVQQEFAQTWQLRHNFDAAEPGGLPDVAQLISQHKSDIVILQVAERHLNFPPTTKK